MKVCCDFWIPAYAGMAGLGERLGVLDSRLRGNDGMRERLGVLDSRLRGNDGMRERLGVLDSCLRGNGGVGGEAVTSGFPPTRE